MKLCRKCGKNKPLEEFLFNAKYIGGRIHTCRSCRLAYSKNYTEVRRKNQKISHAKTSKSAKEFIYRYKESHPCTDCGKKFPYYVMDFDHLRDKKYSISKMLHLSVKAIKTEMRKCELVCSNCHRERTYGKRG